jgi:hypothetical protein
MRRINHAIITRSFSTTRARGSRESRESRTNGKAADFAGSASGYGDGPPPMTYTDNPVYSVYDPRHVYHLTREAAAGLAWLAGNYHRREERAAREKRALAEEIMRSVERQTKAEEEFLLAVRAKAMDELEVLRTETRGRSDAVLSAAREGAKVPEGGGEGGGGGGDGGMHGAEGASSGSNSKNTRSGSDDCNIDNSSQHGGRMNRHYHNSNQVHETASVTVDFGSGSVGLALEELLGERGVRVKDVHPGGAGFQAGIKPGDIIQSIEGQAMTGVADAVEALPRAKADGVATLEFVLFRPKVST